MNNIIQHRIFDEDSNGFQNEGHEQMHVDVVTRAVEFPEGIQGMQSATLIESKIC